MSMGNHDIEPLLNSSSPPLKSAPVFGGIAGIVSNEAEQEDPGRKRNPSFFTRSEIYANQK